MRRRRRECWRDCARPAAGQPHRTQCLAHKKEKHAPSARIRFDRGRFSAGLLEKRCPDEGGKQHCALNSDCSAARALQPSSRSPPMSRRSGALQGESLADAMQVAKPPRRFECSARPPGIRVSQQLEEKCHGQIFSSVVTRCPRRHPAADLPVHSRFLTDNARSARPNARTRRTSTSPCLSSGCRLRKTTEKVPCLRRRQ